VTPGLAWAVVPVKPFHAAKERLAEILDAAERAQLARVMLEDVLDAVAASGHLLAGLIVLTADDEAARLARGRDAIVLRETDPVGPNGPNSLNNLNSLNGALALAAAHLAGDPGAAMLVIPTDLPQVSAAAIAQMVGLLDAARAVVLVPASNDGGTNLLACRPANVIPPSFGPSSFEQHARAARRAGITPRVLTCPVLGQDIDRPEDLITFLSLGTATRTNVFLSTLDLTSRVLK
jgi:2-phospho-L-lactate/phosphoenolpyruvate guanylyltransferase